MRSSKTSYSLKVPDKLWAVHSFTTTGLFISLMALAVPNSAAAQNVPNEIKEALDRKYDILQQQADTERMLAETESKRAEAERRNTVTQKAQYLGTDSASSASQNYDVPRGDALAGTNAATYRLTNGVILQVSGDFWPDPPGVCIANCE